MTKRRVVVTGAAGYVAQRMWKELSDRWDLVPIDVRDTTRGRREGPRDHRRRPHPPRSERVPAALHGRRCRHPLRLRQRAPARRHDLAEQQRRQVSGGARQRGAGLQRLPDRARGGRAPRGGVQLEPRRRLLRAARLGGTARHGDAGDAGALGQLVRLGQGRLRAARLRLRHGPGRRQAARGRAVAHRRAARRRHRPRRARRSQDDAPGARRLSVARETRCSRPSAWSRRRTSRTSTACPS